MPNKPRKKPGLIIEKTIFESFESWLNTVFIGKSPILNSEFCVVGVINHSLKLHLTKTVNEIINNHGTKRQNYKFGKTGRSPKRVEFDDYRSGVYSEMFLLYESTSVKNIEDLEIYYSTKYKPEKRCDNKDTKSLGKMVSINGKYYLYLVI